MTTEATEETAQKPAKVASRPGSQWATGKRKQQKGKTEPKGFYRGARVK
jgi:hypothetical protein